MLILLYFYVLSLVFVLLKTFANAIHSFSFLSPRMIAPVVINDPTLHILVLLYTESVTQ